MGNMHHRCLYETKSHHKHLCRDQTRTYCWYQYMLETHSKSSGHVSMDCYCDPLAPTAMSPTLSPGCYSPSGDDCDRFRNCLERKYPCDYSSTAYALKFAKMFCAMYKEHANKYSHQAQNWMIVRASAFWSLLCHFCVRG